MSYASAAPTYDSGKPRPVALNASSSDDARGAALQFLGQLAAEVSSGTVELPCFPDVVIRIRRTLADPHTTAEQAVTIVGTEPRLAARLLQTANSAAYNPTGKRITDLRTAIARLGYQLVQSSAMAFAVQQVKNEASLRVIAEPLHALWQESIAVASICQVVARRTKVIPDEAFLTGLLHGIGRLYIMVRAVGRSSELHYNTEFLEMVEGWQASIGKAVLENWGFAAETCDAVGEQDDMESKRKHEADLTDVLCASILLGIALRKPQPREVATDGVGVFNTIGLTAQDCATILTHAEYQVGSLHDALGC